MSKEYTYYTADFETENNLDETYVWGAGICKVGSENVEIFGNIKDFMDYCSKIKGKNLIVYFHNLKFDGQFILDYLCRICKFKFNSDSYHLGSKEYSAVVSDMGQWYMIRVKYKKKIIEFRDSLKIIQGSVDYIAKQLKTKAQKLVGEIDYNLHRELTWYLNEEGKWNKKYTLTKREIKYLKNDILVMSEALEKVKKYGLLEKMTIGSHCLQEFKNVLSKEKFESYFPVLEDCIDKEIRKSYKGGWCYCMYPSKVFKGHGYTYDVNSLYPFAMHSKSGSVYPIGTANHFKAEEFERYCKYDCFFVKIKVDLKLKEKHVPFLQIKKTFSKQNEYIYETEDVIELVLTKMDYELMFEQYEINYLEIIEGWWFKTKKGIFDSYIDYWYEIKKNSTNKVERLIAKLMLNNLYGKFSTNPIAGSKIPSFDENENKIKYNVEREQRESVYIPVGSYITSYARCYTIRAAQLNYKIFLYSDTDSIHLLGKAVGIKVGKELGEWDLESEWDVGKFVRQKTYIERNIKEDGKEIEKNWTIKACGCPAAAKERMLYKVNLFEELEKDNEGNILNKKISDEEFIKKFDIGLVESGKLLPKSVPGGCVLVETTFKIL